MGELRERVSERVVREDRRGGGGGGVGAVYVHDESSTDSWKSGDVEMVCQSCRCRCCVRKEAKGWIVDVPDMTLRRV
jgi:hypothetical protein